MWDSILEHNNQTLQRYSEAKFKIINSSLSLNNAIALMKQERISCLLIESQRKLTGILTERDLVELIFSGKDLTLLNVEQVITQEAIFLDVEMDISLTEIASIFQRYHISHIPLVNTTGKGVGIITPSSILSNLDSQELANTIDFLGHGCDLEAKAAAVEKIDKQIQKQQLEIAQLKNQNQKLKTKNQLLQQRLKNECDLDQAYLRDRIQDQKEREELLPKWQFLKTVLEQIPGGVVIAEASSGKYLFVNDNLAKLFCRKTIQFDNLEDYIYFGFLEDDDSLSPLENCPLVKALNNNPVQGEEMRSLGGDEVIRTLFVNSTPIYNSQGTIVAAIATFYDIKNTQQTRLVRQETADKSIFLKEIHHRIKNNLQVVSALLDLQSEQVQDKAAYSLLEKSQARIQTMALIYEKLYTSSNIERIDFADYVNSLTQYLYDSFIEDYKHIDLILNIEPIQLTIDLATPCGLIINELVTNSLQHGFKHQDRGKIQIDFFLDKNSQYNMQVKDDGSGINPQISIMNNFEFLGISMVESLVIEQLKGTWKKNYSNGCAIDITFPRKN